jgi:hypothetical protein
MIVKEESDAQILVLGGVFGLNVEEIPLLLFIFSRLQDLIVILLLAVTLLDVLAIVPLRIDLLSNTSCSTSLPPDC